MNEHFSSDLNPNFNPNLPPGIYPPAPAGGDPAFNGKAVTSLVLGLIGLIAWFIPLFGLPITIIGLVMGVGGLKSVKRGLAVAGVALSILGLAASLVNASIGAYLGATGQHPLINRVLRTPPVRAGNLPQTAGKTLAGGDLKIYANSKYGFSLLPPAGWKVNESGQSGTLVILVNPQVDREGEKKFCANLNVVSEAAQGKDLNAYTRAALKLYPKIIPGYRNLEDREIVTLSGEKARLISGTFTQDGYRIKNAQLVAVKDGRAWIVTATALESTWEKYRELTESSLLSFEKN